MVNVLTMPAVLGIWGISAVSVIMVSQEMELQTAMVRLTCILYCNGICLWYLFVYNYSLSV